MASKDFLDHQEKMGTIRAVISTPTKASLIKQGIRRYLGYQDTNPHSSMSVAKWTQNSFLEQMIIIPTI